MTNKKDPKFMKTNLEFLKQKVKGKDRSVKKQQKRGDKTKEAKEGKAKVTKKPTIKVYNFIKI